MARILASRPTANPASPAAPELSVVMPCYNEAANIGAAIGDVIEHVFAAVPHAELVVVDDGSRDASADIAGAWASRDSRVRIVTQANAGHGPALLTGIRAARGTHCLLLDSDRQIGLDAFARTWQLGREHDAVLGVREARADARHRLLLSAALRGIVAAAFGVNAQDPNVPYKLVRRDVLLEAIATMPREPLIPSVLVTIHLGRSGRRIAWQPVAHFARTAGRTTLRPRRLAVFCTRALRELLAFARAAPRRR